MIKIAFTSWIISTVYSRDYDHKKLFYYHLLSASIMYGIFCLILTFNGIVYLNQENWNIYIPYLDLNFGAWRIFLIMCSVPSVAAATVMAFLIPESPKFTYAQGDEVETLKILRKIFRTNTGKSILEYEVKKIEKDEEYEEAQKKKNCGFFEFMWSQTVPLFKKPHLKNTATACFLQFVICFACNGYYVFFPEISNKIQMWLKSDPLHASATVCEVLDTYNNQTISTEIEINCVTKIELEAYLNIVMLTCFYVFGWLAVSITIDYTGKLIQLVTWLLASGISSILIIFLTSPNISMYLYLVLLVSGINMAIVNSSTVELYPTTLR